VVIAILMLLLRFVVPLVIPGALYVAVLSGPVGGLAVVLWWLLFSRARWFERLGAVALMLLALFATKRIVDVSIATGAMGSLFPFLAIPTLGVALVVWAVATHRLSDGVRRVTMVATILLACGVWALVRTGGFTAASFKNDLHWRWTKTPEERLVAKSGSELGALPPATAVPPPAPAGAKTLEKGDDARLASKSGNEQAALSPVRPAAEAPEKRLVAKAGSAPAPLPSAPPVPAAEWPGFRGPHRDDIIPGVRIKTDWTASPPVALWRRPVGPGWSSFAVRGDRFYTQEQRGADEVVACYKLTTGEPVWAHRDTARFWESNGGPGPRGTPTLSNGRVYTFGATGILNVLNERDGSVVWSRNAASDTGMAIPQWGFASSPLVIDDLVVVATAGRLVAYDLATGAKRWMSPARGVSCMGRLPHRATGAD
jgi:hypothetical protein